RRATAEPVQLHLHMPKTGGTTLNRIVYRQYIERTPPGRRSAGRRQAWLDRAGLEYTPGGLYHVLDGFGKEPVRALSTPNMISHRPRAILGHFSFGLHASLSYPTRYI